MSKTRRKDKIWLRRADKKVQKILSLKPEMAAMTDEELRNKTEDLKKRYQNGESLDRLLVEAYALVREAALRVNGMEHYPVQLISGIALHEGKIAEQKTGEGKTLVATLPAFLNALTGKGVHVVTVNNYLASRDAAQMGKVHGFLGLSVGVVLSDMSQTKKKEAYACDITYVTNTELGFDYLRDNMAQDQNEVVQRGLNYAIIDEVDSVLIDEARTPLIISGSGHNVAALYLACSMVAKKLERGAASREFNKIDAILGETPEETGDFIVHEKEKNITLTAMGIRKIEEAFGLENYADPKNTLIQHAIDQCLRANYLMKKDKDYVVKNGKIQIVDTFTGRVQDGRQFSDGLHQAIEAKEGVEIREENKTVATTTYQRFFNKYTKICGMTGTADTEKREFKSTYHLDTIVIPTNKPVIRIDRPNVIYLTKKGKYNGVIEEVKTAYRKGQPVLIGTASIKTSEEVDYLLSLADIPHQVLNAKQDEREAEIIAKAGIHGTVTVATNMAGRGTDIILDEEAKAAGGLKVIGTELHEAKRIDNQLRGRAGRQGDPGESVFFISAEDQMVRLFTQDKFKRLLEVGGFDEDKPIEGKVFARYIAAAQKKVEDNNFDVRKNVMDYDFVNDAQREMIYAERRKILSGESIQDEFMACMDHFVDILIAKNTRQGVIDVEKVVGIFNAATKSDYVATARKKELSSSMKAYLHDLYNVLSNKNAEESRNLERYAILKSIDSAWREQLSALEFLRQDIWYLGFAQIDPKSAYAIHAFELYSAMKENIYWNAVRMYFGYHASREQSGKNTQRKDGN